MTHRSACRILLAAASAALAAGRTARAELRADQLVLIVNRNEPAGAQLAAFYADQRHVPAGRVCTLDLPTENDISAHDYAERVVQPVRAFLHDHGLEPRVACLVPFYGVPLRIAARHNTPAEATEMAQDRGVLISLPDRIRPAVEGVEAVARQADPQFTPAAGRSLDELDVRWSAAARLVLQRLAKMPQGPAASDLARRLFHAAGPLLGESADLRVRELDLAQHPDRRAADGPLLQADAKGLAAADVDAGRLQLTPEDPAARAALRRAVEARFGLLEFAKVLHEQLDYLDERHGGMAFDSELALVRWPVHMHNYPGGNPYASGPGRQQWFANPLSYEALAQHRVEPAPTLMVTRLDGPTPGLVKAMIATSVRVEADGLHGKVVIDSLGGKDGHDPVGHPGYGGYDATLARLDQLLAGRPGLDVVFDDKPDVLPPHSASDVAAYVGWYAVGGYVPSCSFAGGAVAMHVASYTLTTLRQTPNPNWAVGLIDDGVVATIGPVQEPFLFAFPNADDFFPLLMTGRLTLAECYWRTERVAGWQMACVGDPLYTPYRADPVLAVTDLPPRLQGLFPPTATAIAPAVKSPPPPGR